MLHPWIIEQIRKQEEEVRRRHEPRPHVDMPTYRPPSRREDSNRYGDDDRDQPKGDRGVVIIDL